jgi:hypothetical protein
MGKTIGLLTLGLTFCSLATSAIADTWADHQYCAGAWCIYDYEYSTNNEPNVLYRQLIYSRGVENCEGTPKSRTITDSCSTTHSWAVGVTGEFDGRPGLLARVVAEAHVRVAVNGQYSGGGQVVRSISYTGEVPACRKRMYKLFTDKYSVEQMLYHAERHWYCPTCEKEGEDYVSSIEGTGCGDDNDVDRFEDNGECTQNGNPCLDCYKP